MSRVDRFLPIYRLMFVFSVCRLVSRRCHSISTMYPLAPAPHRIPPWRDSSGKFTGRRHKSKSESLAAISDSRFSLVDNAFIGSVSLIVSPPRYTCLSTPSLHPALAGLQRYYELIRLPVPHPQPSFPRL